MTLFKNISTKIQAVYDYSESTKNSLIRVYCTSEGLVSEEVRRTGKPKTT